jgi:hypothetical protein
VNRRVEKVVRRREWMERLGIWRWRSRFWGGRRGKGRRRGR